MDATDRLIINRLQGGFPISDRPFEDAADSLSLDEDILIDRLRALVADGTLSRFGPLYNAEAMGGGLTLAAMAVPAGRFDAVAEIVDGFVEVAHNYERDHELNMWFVVATERPEQVGEVLEKIAAATGLPVLDLPKQEEFFLELRLDA